MNSHEALAKARALATDLITNWPKVLIVVFAIAMAAFPLVDADGQTSAPGFTIVETGERFSRLDQAVERVGARRATIEIGPGRYRDCAIQQSGHIVFRAAQAGTVIFDGGICEQKATLVLRGEGAEVHGLIFENLRVPDGNGAGIRLERSNLLVSNSWFRNSEQGILSANDPSATLTIDKSTFTSLGRCDRGLPCAHSIYINDYGRLVVTRSRFEHGSGGHYIKSRSPIADIRGNSFDDTSGRGTNYMIDLPDGARGVITDNIFVQGQNKENWSAFIAVSAERRTHSAADLVIYDNDARLAPGVDRNTWFVADWSGEKLALGANALGSGLTAYQRR